MNRPLRLRITAIVLLTAAIPVACEKKKPPAPLQAVVPTEFDSAPPPSAPTSQTVLEKTFIVKTSSTFSFDVPPRIVRPHLHGIFTSSVPNVHLAGDGTANVDLVILSAAQYEDISAGRPGESLLSVEATHNQSVNLDLPASFDQPAKYYVIFRNSSGKPPSKTVQASFRVDY